MSESALPLDEITIASSSGLLNSIHTGVSSQAVHSKPSQLKLGPVPMAQRLKEQVSRTLRDEDAAADGSSAEPNGSETAGENGPADEQTNGDGDVEMADGKESAAGTGGDDKEPAPVEVKLEPDLEVASDLVSPAENETNPPVPPLFQLSDLRREVEAVRDRRKMIRFGPNADEAKLGESSTAALPSVVAFTVFDGGEGYVKPSCLAFHSLGGVTQLTIFVQRILDGVLDRLVFDGCRLAGELYSNLVTQRGEAQGQIARPYRWDIDRRRRSAHAQANRTFWSCIFTLLRLGIWILGPAAIAPVVFARWYSQIMVAEHVLESGGISRA